MSEAETKDESTITELWGIFDPKQSRWTVALDEAGEPRLFCLTEAEAKACAAFQEDAFELDGLEVRRVAVGVNAALVEAAESRIARGHNDTCQSQFAGPEYPCNCGHDQLTAAIAAAKGE